MGSRIVYYLVQSLTAHFDGYICTDGVDDDSGEEIICKNCVIKTMDMQTHYG
jgi:hypothetical protein